MSSGAKKKDGRANNGRWVKGQSGNPAGRPKGSKNRIVAMKQDLELAIRENITSGEVRKIVNAMIAEAQDGNVSAAKLILDKVMSNAKVDEDITESQGGISINIKNLTVDSIKEVEGEVIDNDEES